MYLNKMVRGYNKYFGFFSTLRTTIHVNKYILAFFIGSLVFPIWFIISIYHMNNLGIIISSIAFAICVFTNGFLVRLAINKSFGSTDNFAKERLKKFSKIIRIDLQCTNIEQIQYLEEMIEKEIELLDEMNKYPFADIIKSLTTGVLITGLLSFSLNALIDGDIDLAIPLLTIYLSIIGLMIIVSSVVYNAKEYTRKYKYFHIRVLLSKIKINMVNNLSDHSQKL